MAGTLDHWTEIKNSQIISSDLHKWLEHWTIGPKSKIHRLYQVIYHKGLKHWTIGPKSKNLRLFQVTFHKQLEHWTIGPK